ncbi:MAG: hypothetical protein ABI172_02885 [Ginsengibacter sp.]
MEKLITIIIIVGLFTGCSSKELSREEASKIIKQEMKYPKVVDYDLFCGDPVYAKKVLDAGLEEKGLVTVHRTLKLGDIGKPIIEFTDKAKPYLLPTPEEDKKSLIQKVKIADEELVDVTGIQTSEGGKRAIAEYTTAYKNISDFAALTRRNYNKPGTNKAYFALYDDGWRLEKRR